MIPEHLAHAALAEIDRRWDQRRPLSTNSVTRYDGRYAPIELSRQLGVPPGTASDLVRELFTLGVLVMDKCDCGGRMMRGMRSAEHNSNVVAFPVRAHTNQQPPSPPDAAWEEKNSTRGGS
jgi:hypothetical protein